MYQPYHVEKINERVYNIHEDIAGGHFHINIYLVLGSERAALIDTGLGTGNLLAVVQSLTSLPVIVLHTHGHIDHVGADGQFFVLYLNEKERTFFEQSDEMAMGERRRETLVKLHVDDPDLPKEILKHCVPLRLQHYRDVEEGCLFDLGGVQLDTVATPGHSEGSVSFVDKKNHYAFTGDGIANIHWFDKTVDTTVESFLHMLQHFKESAPGVTTMYAAHPKKPFYMSLVNDLERGLSEILEGSDDPMENADFQFLKHGILYVHRTGRVTIYYDPAHVWEDFHPANEVAVSAL
ncbi:MAG TPA: hypothetical protein DEP42_00175 [Ruminococcaceae bacterium]|nr:hypothetical protein [Oscillospiraceae bacterium]